MVGASPTSSVPSLWPKRHVWRGYLHGMLLQVAGWVAAAALFHLIRFRGLESVAAFEGVDWSRLDLGFYLEMMLLAGAVLGLAYGILDIVLDRPRFRRMPYGKLILTQTSFHVGLVILIVAALRLADLVQVGRSITLEDWFARTFSVNTLIVILYTAVVSFAFNFVKQVNRKFGPGNLVKILLGKYYHPHQERRIFMFLDLKSSTTHAEQLGHIRYSSLIQECFWDLAVVVADRAEVYQYVGDEAVLCWDAAVGLQDLNCIRAFFHYQARLRERAPFYEQAYGFVPEFKAGLNIGEVTVVEVGEIKKEIAFHGDVLNAAARIQGLCNEYQEQILISKHLRDALPRSDAFVIRPIGHLQLRGRNKLLDVFAVRESPPSGVSA